MPESNLFTALTHDETNADVLRELAYVSVAMIVLPFFAFYVSSVHLFPQDSSNYLHSGIVAAAVVVSVVVVFVVKAFLLDRDDRRLKTD